MSPSYGFGKESRIMPVLRKLHLPVDDAHWSAREFSRFALRCFKTAKSQDILRENHNIGLSISNSTKKRPQTYS